MNVPIEKIQAIEIDPDKKTLLIFKADASATDADMAHLGDSVEEWTDQIADALDIPRGNIVGRAAKGVEIQQGTEGKESPPPVCPKCNTTMWRGDACFGDGIETRNAWLCECEQWK